MRLFRQFDHKNERCKHYGIIVHIDLTEPLIIEVWMSETGHVTHGYSDMPEGGRVRMPLTHFH